MSETLNDLRITGQSLVACKAVATKGDPFHAYSPVDGRALDQEYVSASIDDVDSSVNAAAEAFFAFAASTGKERGHLLRSIADALDASASVILPYANLETSLPFPRLTGELARTTGQLRLFAGMIEEGSWIMARVDTSDPARTPPKPDIRSMLHPLGPVAVFGASNFPLAFSVAGGDTASALAAGNPVVVKAHPAHPATSEIVGRTVAEVIKASEFPAGIFSLLFDRGHEVGTALVEHPGIRAVAFTGSTRGGRALMDMAARRPDPIPVYAEMGSTNPVFVLPGALHQRGAELAMSLHASFTLGGGQQCTKPGIIFAPAPLATEFSKQLRSATEGSPAFSLLTEGISNGYRKSLKNRDELKATSATSSPADSDGYWVQPVLLETSSQEFLTNTHLAEEVFGPTTLLVHCSSTDEMVHAAHLLEGHLTATVLATEEDLQQNMELLRILETKAGRIIINGVPTGVEVCNAMVHGGPYPATSDARSTSVGHQAIYRFTRPVAYQNWPQSALPAALQDKNPLGIIRQWNGVWTSSPGN